ncbi:MAG: ATP-binding cassette, subfamily bacterial RamA/AmfB, partial [Pseudonocardiales bacterium]|nr:ATP-binding cassette, subfamily bacterial RamA/AmfB [Pseudonocardiales bacterium]
VAWLDRGNLRGLRPHSELWRDPDYRALFGAEAVPAQPDGVPA